MDGTCADLTEGEACDNDALESPCGCSGLEFACAKIINSYDDCMAEYQEYYDDNAECIENEEDNLPQVDFNGPAFKACYITLISVTMFMFGWCAYNQRISPVEYSTHSLVMAKKNGSEEEDTASLGERWTQTGYKRTVVGSVLHGLIVLVLLGFQALLLFLTID